MNDLVKRLLGNCDGGTFERMKLCVEAAAEIERLQRLVEPPPDWRAILKRARDGISAGSHSVSDIDTTLAIASPLLDHLAEQFESAEPAAPASAFKWPDFMDPKQGPVLETAAPEQCKQCLGTGRWSDHPCRFCNGLGVGSVFKVAEPAAPGDERGTPREFWDLLHEWRDTANEERIEFIENRFNELFALAARAAAPAPHADIAGSILRELVAIEDLKTRIHARRDFTAPNAYRDFQQQVEEHDRRSPLAYAAARAWADSAPPVAAPAVIPDGFALLNRADLRSVVDHVWATAHESGDVPSTTYADQMIAHALGDDWIASAQEPHP